MSRNQALRFIEAVAGSVELQNELRALRRRADLQAVAQLASAHGFSCTPEELRAAFVDDWKMRRAFYGGEVEEAVDDGATDE